MSLESSTTIDGLDANNPVPNDPVGQGDDHLRLLKTVLKTTFPGTSGNGFAIPITATEAELNYLDGVNSPIQTQLNTANNFTQGGTGAVQRTSTDKLKDTVSVKDFGAVGDGVTDDTSAIQAAVDYGIAQTCVVNVPSGNYRLTSKITFDGSIRFVGTTFAHYHPPTPRTGSRFFVDFTTAVDIGAFYIVGPGVEIEHIQFYSRDTRTGGAAWEPTANQPWCVYITRPLTGYQYGDGAQLRHIGLDGVAYGIKTKTCYAHIDDVRATCFNVCVEFDGAYDVAKLSNLMLSYNFWAWADGVDVPTYNAIYAYQDAHLTAIRLGRVDNPIFTNNFILSGNIGVEFFESTDVTPGGHVSKASFSGMGFDSPKYCFKYTNVSITDVMVSNSYFSGGSTDSTCIYGDVTSTDNLLNMSACLFAAGSSVTNFLGENNQVNMSACRIERYNYIDSDKVCFLGVSGNQIVMDSACALPNVGCAPASTYVRRGSSHSIEGIVVSTPASNMIQNGDMANWARGVTYTVTTNGEKLADTYSIVSDITPAKIEVTRNSAVPAGTPFPYAMHIEVTTAVPSLTGNQHLYIKTVVEGTIAKNLHLGTNAALPTYLSFWTRSNKTGVYCVKVSNAGGTNSMLIDFNIPVAETWYLISVPMGVNQKTGHTWVTDISGSLVVSIMLASNATVAIPNVWVNTSYHYQTSANAQNFLATLGNIIRFTGFCLTQSSTPNVYQAQTVRPSSRYIQTLAVYVPASTVPALITFPAMRAAPTITGGGTGFSATNITVNSAVISQTTAAAQTLILSAEL